MTVVQVVGKNPETDSRNRTVRPLRIIVLPLLILVGLTAFTSPARAEPDDEFRAQLDLSRRNDSLVVWIDVSGLLSSTLTARIRDGIDLGIRCRAELTRPRRLFGADQVASQSRYWTLSFQLATEQYLLQSSTGDSKSIIHFQSLARVAAWLADSLSIILYPLDSLDAELRYEAAVEITSISLSNNYLEGGGSDEGGSVLRSLFGAFLDITGYGRESTTIRSRPFLLSEIQAR